MKNEPLATLLKKEDLINNKAWIERLEILDRGFFPWPWKPGEMHDFFLKEDSLVLALSKGDMIQSFLMGRIDRHLEQFHLYKILTDPKARGQGLGYNLFRELYLDLDKSSVREIYLEVEASNEVAIKFYRKSNLSIIHTVENFYSDGSKANIMLGNVNLNLFN